MPEWNDVLPTARPSARRPAVHRPRPAGTGLDAEPGAAQPGEPGAPPPALQDGLGHQDGTGDAHRLGLRDERADAGKEGVGHIAVIARPLPAGIVAHPDDPKRASPGCAT